MGLEKVAPHFLSTIQFFHRVLQYHFAKAHLDWVWLLSPSGIMPKMPSRGLVEEFSQDNGKLVQSSDHIGVQIHDGFHIETMHGTDQFIYVASAVG